MNGFKMYVVAHRPFDYLKTIKDIPGYTPIHCGKSIYTDTEQGYLPELGDNTGNNISWKNRYYCELTGLYWIWKNDKSQPDDIVGIEHYRRYFGDDVDTPLSHKHAEHILTYYDFIVNGAAVELQDLVRPQVECGEFDLGEYSVYRGYRDCHVISDMDCALRGIKELYPDLYPVINYELRQNGAMAICNMMVTYKRYLDEFCSFLFPLYSWMEKELNFQELMHTGENQRFFGYLSERLLHPWLMATKHTAYTGAELDFSKYSGYEWD